MQMRLFQKLTPEPHVSFHLEEFSFPHTTQSSLLVVLRSPGLPCVKQNKTHGAGGGRLERRKSRVGG